MSVRAIIEANRLGQKPLQEIAPLRTVLAAAPDKTVAKVVKEFGALWWLACYTKRMQPPALIVGRRLPSGETQVTIFPARVRQFKI